MDSRKYNFNKSTLTVRFGNIIDSKAEVIVSSDDSHVTMGGGVSRAILNAAGVSVFEDAKKLTPVPMGGAVVTSAGNMKHQKYIFHCITIDKTTKKWILAGKVTQEEVLNYILQHAVDKCFQLMQAMEITSIAFPAIGAGVAEIPIKKVIEQMSTAIARNLANTNKSLNVELYVYDIYNLYTQSDYITLFEHLAAKAALVEYKQGLATIDDEVVIQTNKSVPIPEKNAMHHKVFISYSRQDLESVENLCKLLGESGIDYWIDKEGIYSSSNYKELIVDAIEVSKAVLFISSINSNASTNVVREISYAVNLNKPVLPLMLDDAQFARSLRLDLSDVDQIDFRNPMASHKKLITSLMFVLNR